MQNQPDAVARLEKKVIELEAERKHLKDEYASTARRRQQLNQEERQQELEAMRNRDRAAELEAYLLALPRPIPRERAATVARMEQQLRSSDAIDQINAPFLKSQARVRRQKIHDCDRTLVLFAKQYEDKKKMHTAALRALQQSRTEVEVRAKLILEIKAKGECAQERLLLATQRSLDRIDALGSKQGQKIEHTAVKGAQKLRRSAQVKQVVGVGVHNFLVTPRLRVSKRGRLVKLRLLNRAAGFMVLVKIKEPRRSLRVVRRNSNEIVLRVRSRSKVAVRYKRGNRRSRLVSVPLKMLLSSNR